eukprot:scaffold64515_cov51-Prasinocladus_malaysianus.AAC.1
MIRANTTIVATHQITPLSTRRNRELPNSKSFTCQLGKAMSKQSMEDRPGGLRRCALVLVCLVVENREGDEEVRSDYVGQHEDVPNLGCWYGKLTEIDRDVAGAGFPICNVNGEE